MKEQAFETEINMIKDKDIKESVTIILKMLPDYFYEIPASSTGKYHPSFSLGNKGLIRHTKVATRIAYELLQLEIYNTVFNNREKDLIIMSIILHDGLKKGIKEEQYTRFDHPILMSNFINEHKNELSLSEEDIKIVTSAIASHMGQWNKDKYSKVILPVPVTKIERFVHMCDYLSSKKFLNVSFDKENNVIEEQNNSRQLSL